MIVTASGYRIYSILTTDYSMDDGYVEKKNSGLKRILCGILANKKFRKALAATIYDWKNVENGIF